jgi:hypothetical protein
VQDAVKLGFGGREELRKDAETQNLLCRLSNGWHISCID